MDEAKVIEIGPEIETAKNIENGEIKVTLTIPELWAKSHANSRELLTVWYLKMLVAALEQIK